MPSRAKTEWQSSGALAWFTVIGSAKPWFICGKSGGDATMLLAE